jgi:hypothetical protein
MMKRRGPRLRTIWDRVILRLKGIAKCGRSTHVLISTTATRRVRICVAATGEVAGVLGRRGPWGRWVVVGIERSSWSICGSWRLGLKLWRSGSWRWWELLTLRIEASLSGIRVVSWLRCRILLLLLLRIVWILIGILAISYLLFLHCIVSVQLHKFRRGPLTFACFPVTPILL